MLSGWQSLGTPNNEGIANTIVQLFRVNVSGVVRLSPTDAIGTVAPRGLHFYE
jgi:hypothetical protein